MNATNFADEKASVDEKRAAAERFSMTVCENGYVNVCNESHNDDSDHTYSVEVTDGKATGCPCLHAVHRGAHCKHQIAVENSPIVVSTASATTAPVATDGGEDTIIGDDGDERPTRSESPHMGGGESSGVDEL